MEWLYHIGVPREFFEDYAPTIANTIPCMMPYITASFMLHAFGDKPDADPKNAVSFVFLGQLSEIKRDTIFTAEYSIRTAMEAVYTFLDNGSV